MQPNCLDVDKEKHQNQDHDKEQSENMVLPREKPKYLNVTKDQSVYLGLGNSSCTPSLTLEATHLLEPLPTSPSLVVFAPRLEVEQEGLLVRLQDLGPEVTKREGEEETEAQQGSGESERSRRLNTLAVRGRLCLERVQQALYACVTCLVRCLGPV